MVHNVKFSHATGLASRRDLLKATYLKRPIEHVERIFVCYTVSRSAKLRTFVISCAICPVRATSRASSADQALQQVRPDLPGMLSNFLHGACKVAIL